ncbi:hypothetical protein MRX96_002588 [Rhipicephalus microplus]
MLRGVCLCLVVLLLFATKLCSSRSLETNNESDRQQLKLPARLKPQNCSHRGQSICQKYGKICVSYDGGEVCIERSKPKKCSERGQSVCQKYGTKCVSYDGGEVCVGT